MKDQQIANLMIFSLIFSAWRPLALGVSDSWDLKNAPRNTRAVGRGDHGRYVSLGPLGVVCGGASSFSRWARRSR